MIAISVSLNQIKDPGVLLSFFSSILICLKNGKDDDIT